MYNMAEAASSHQSREEVGDQVVPCITAARVYEENKTQKGWKDIYFIRHGDYHRCPKGDMFQKLTEIGQQQALRMGSFLQSSGIDITSLFTSTMARARETTALIKKCITINAYESDLLREIPFCAAFGKIIPEHYEERAAKAFDFHFGNVAIGSPTTEVFVCHANLIRYFLSRILDIPFEETCKYSLGHCSITKIHLEFSGKATLQYINFVDHLANLN